MPKRRDITEACCQGREISCAPVHGNIRCGWVLPAATSSPASALSTSTALPKRFVGLRSRHRRMAASHLGSRSGTWVRGEAGASSECFTAIENAESPTKGRVPVTISYSCISRYLLPPCAGALIINHFSQRAQTSAVGLSFLGPLYSSNWQSAVNCDRQLSTCCQYWRTATTVSPSNLTNST